jgi:ABC-type lipoprotein release transport system permease subunit
MVLDQKYLKELKNTTGVNLVVPRFETYSLISHGNKTKVVQITGINPELENQLTNLKKKIVSGEYFSDSSKGIIVAQGLAEILKVEVGDSVVIYGQGYHGVTAAAQIPIVGIVKFTLPELNKSFTYLSLPYAQWLFSAPGRLTSLSIMIDKPKEIDRVKSGIRKVFARNYEVMDWEELSPELVQSIQIDNASGIIMLGILYVVIAFGIFGTIMMMTAERVKEFGILISIGMKKWKLGIVTLFETLFVSFLGVFTGAIISIPILLYLKANPIPLTGEYAEAILAFGFEPILPFAIYPGMYFAQIWTVLAIAIVSASYPILFIRKLQPVEALRG